MESPVRRQLSFDTLDAAVADARGLLVSGYRSAGKWDLAQVCGHCADWLRFPVEGYPRGPLPIRAMLWLMKVTVGKTARHKILRERRFKTGTPTMPATVKPRGAIDDAAGVDELARAVDQFQRHSGPYHSSPLFGNMTRAEHEQLQRIHLAHHLSFLLPKR